MATKLALELVIDKTALRVHTATMSKFIQKFINKSRGRSFEGGDGRGGTSSVGSVANSGLTEGAQAQQSSASSRLKQKRKAFQTVFAGETGNVTKSGSLGITGQI